WAKARAEWAAPALVACFERKLDRFLGCEKRSHRGARDLEISWGNADFDSTIRTQVVKHCSIRQTPDVALQRQPIQPDLELVHLRRFFAVSFVIDQHQFARFLEPQVDFPAQNNIFDVEKEVEFAFDLCGAGCALPEFTNGEAVGELGRVRRSRAAGENLMDREPERCPACTFTVHRPLPPGY